MKIFVSYTLKDCEITQSHLLHLKKQLLPDECFIDILDNTAPAEEKQERVLAELDSSDEVLLVNTSGWQKSEWVVIELNRAIQRGIPIKKINIKDINMAKHRVFISYHHANDQWYKNELIQWNGWFNLFEDYSVHVGDIDDSNMTDEQIRTYIRDNYLRQSTVTILLVGTETRFRKHVDWELYSSMHNTENNPKSGIIVVMLPSTGCTHCYAGHEGEKETVCTNYSNWRPVTSEAQFERDYPNLPPRIIDNLMTGTAKITIVKWEDLTPQKLAVLIDNAYNDREKCTYSFYRPMRRRNN